MARKRPDVVDESSQPLANRIATGLHKIGMAMKHQAWQQASDEGLSPTQGQILAVLVAHGPLTGSELSERLGVTLPTISESVRALVDKELVTRAPDPRHPRASLLTPTARGTALGARARSWPEFMADAVSDLPPDEQRAFFSGVVKMVRALAEQGLVPVNGMCVTCVHFRPHVHAGETPHHCAYVDAALGAGQLRLDCREHEAADPTTRRDLWARFLRAT